jgi:hypothetical protein
MFKKLQENWLYWRFRFVTRRWVELKRWWRERRAPRPRVVTGPYRGMARGNPYVSSATSNRRGVAFVLALTAALTALQVALGSLTGVSFGVLFVIVVVAMTYLFARFWP